MNTEAFRLHPGTDLKRELKRLAKENDLRAAFILSCVGSLSFASIRMAGAQPDSEIVKTFNEPLEIISLVGTLSADGIHVHVGLARADGQCIGGHLDDGCIVKTTAELIICELSHLEFRRTPDEKTGFRELSIHKRSF
jgi:uncharacterized protein